MPPLNATEEKTNTKMCLQIFTSNRVTNKRSILLSKQPASLVGSGLLAASPLSLSCTPDTTVNMMLKIVLAMLILVVFFVDHLPLSLSCTLDTTCNKMLMILLAMLILIVCFFLGHLPSFLSCIFTKPDMIMLLLLLMLRLILC